MNSAELYTGPSNAQDWYAQFGQSFVSHSGKTYIVGFTAKADSSVSFIILLQQTHDPYGSILSQTVSLTASPKSFVFTNSITASDDSLILTFMLGWLNNRTVWVDNFSVTEQ